MTERTIRETNNATYIRGYWVGGQRFHRPHGKAGWYIVTFSDSLPLTEYWVVEGRFYKALIRWVEERTFDIETIREVTEVGSERKTIMLEAIGRWEINREESGIQDTQSKSSQYHSLNVMRHHAGITT